MIKRRRSLKRNFYYLWQMAEAYKIQFYRDMNFVSINFNDDRDRKIGIPDDNKYYLYVRKTEDGDLERLDNPMSGIEITNNEIHRLLCADIYSLLKTVLYAYDANNNEQELLKYTYYKLSGQSCKITLFNELLKEFIPGKYLRYDAKRVPDSSELKLSCIKGSIYYMYDIDFGKIKPYITMEAPALIYNVCKFGNENQLDIMLYSVGGKINIEVQFMPAEATRAKFAVLSQNGKYQNTIDFIISKNSEREITTTQLKAYIVRNVSDDTGEIGNAVVKALTNINLSLEKSSVYAFFAVPSKTGYGFYIYCVRVGDDKDSRYHLTQEPEYYSFEDNELATFFDGSK